MVGILIVAHGTLGESLIHCASHVMGARPPQLMQIGVTIHDDPAQILPQALRLTKQLDQGSGVLVLTDVYGATPGNIAARLLIPGRVEGVAGVNLPMLRRRRRCLPHASGHRKCSDGKLISSTSWACTPAPRRS
jgi:PTS system mannose-specific IIA component